MRLKKPSTLSELAPVKTLESSHHKTRQCCGLSISQIRLVVPFVINMQSSLCFALLATVSALQAPTSLTQQRRVVAQRAPLDLSAPKSSTALCAADDDGYEAPKIEFDPDAPTGGRDLWRDGVELNL